MAERLRIAFAAGGTGGHVYPAVGIAEAIVARRPDASVTFFGTRGKIEERVIPSRGWPLVTIWISGFHRSFRLTNLLFPLKVIVSVFQSRSALKRLAPSVVVGTGGYVCGPVLYAASRLGIPTVIHESNSYPGVTTRALSSRADLVLLAYEESKRHLTLPRGAEVVGTPIRSMRGNVTAPEARRSLGLDPDRFTVLVVGGSQGAASINTAIARTIGELRAAGVQLVWQTGAKEADVYQHLAGPDVVVSAFFADMEQPYAAADLVVCRAGASTLAELTGIGKASVLVPYPHAAGDHQTKNARMLAEAGAAVLVPDGRVADDLAREIVRLRNAPEQTRTMARLAREHGRPDAAAAIADRILSMTSTV